MDPAAHDWPWSEDSKLLPSVFRKLRHGVVASSLLMLLADLVTVRIAPITAAHPDAASCQRRTLVTSG